MVKGRANLNSLSLNYLFLVEISFRMVLPSPFFLSCSLFFFFLPFTQTFFCPGFLTPREELSALKTPLKPG